MNNMKRQKDMKDELKDELPRSFSNMLLEKSREVTPERMKWLSQSKNSAQLWMWLVMEARFDVIKNNTA